MTSSLTVYGFGYVVPHASVGGAEGTSELPKLDLALLERTLRRGLSEVTRLFMHAAKLALADAALDPRTHIERIQVIFGSAFGEIATAEALLAEAYEADSSSPARFRHSVHNTAPGLFSISAKNRQPCTAVAAGWDTVAMGLFEAAAQLADDTERVLLVFAEERVPMALSRDHDHGPLAASLVLGRGNVADRSARARLSLPRRVARTELGIDDGPFAHPLAPLLSLARALEQRGTERLAIGDGDKPWCVDVDSFLAERSP